MFNPLPIVRTSELIEKEIQKAIVGGKLRPGDKLPTEKDMAQQFGVSLVTLREALRALQILGLIRKRKGHGGGVFISEVDNGPLKDSLGHYLGFKDLSPRHLYEVRQIIEPRAARVAAQEMAPDEIERMERNVLYCEERLKSVNSIAIDEKDFFDLDSKNNEFHRLLANGTHNPILSLTVDYVLDFLGRCETGLLVPDLNYTVDNIRDHRNVLECLRRKDGDQCEQEMVLHLKRLDEHVATLKKTASRK